MFPWSCCRSCLNTTTLHPIFPKAEHCEKYTNIILTATGMQVESNDTLPQEMCSLCISFVNETVRFRKRCRESQKYLLERNNDKEVRHIKLESNILKLESEKATEIDISDLIDSDDQFQDYDDHIPLDALQYTNNCIEKSEQTDIHIEFETRVQNIERPIELILNNKKKKISSISKGTKATKRKTRSKKENRTEDKKDKGERKREEIECEYCHKILTSKLSLRNHYKIHTGFDVVCEHCGKKFITRRLLLMHCRAKHGYEKTDKCSFCDYKGSNAEQVKCDQCPARFKSVTLMRIHKNRHRAPQYSFRCRVCDNSFARRRNVCRHLQRIHGLPPEHEHIDRLKIQ